MGLTKISSRLESEALSFVRKQTIQHAVPSLRMRGAIKYSVSLIQ